MSGAHLVVIAGVCLSGLSFLIYLIETIAAMRLRPVAESKAIALQAGLRAGFVGTDIPKPTLADFTALLGGLSKLIDSLSKAGPALTSIAASVLFLLIAAIGAGAFQGAPKEPTAQSDAQPQAKSPAQNVQPGDSGATKGGPINTPDQKS